MSVAAAVVREEALEVVTGLIYLVIDNQLASLILLSCVFLHSSITVYNGDACRTKIEEWVKSLTLYTSASQQPQNVC